MALIAACKAFDFKPSAPVIWVNTSTLAISGRRHETIGILIGNVCYKIMELRYKQIVRNFTDSQCSKMQSVSFEQPLKRFCAKLGPDNRNQARNIKTLFGLMLGFDSQFDSLGSSNTTELWEKMKHKLDSNVTNGKKDLGKNGLQINLDQFEASELKENFHVMLLKLEGLIRQKTKQIDENDSYLRLLDKFGMDFERVGDFLVAENSSLISCAMNSNSTLIATLDLATSKRDDFVYKALPFTMYDQVINRPNVWCEYRFNSTGFGFYNKSTVKTCFSSKSRISYLDCREPPAQSHQHFQPLDCFERQPVSMLQVKLFKGWAHVYCPGLQIRINDLPFQDCPNFVFQFQLDKIDRFDFNETHGKYEQYWGDEGISKLLNEGLFGSNFEYWKGQKPNWMSWLSWLSEQLLFRWYGLVGVSVVGLIVLCFFWAWCYRRSELSSDEQNVYREEEELKANLSSLKYLNNPNNYDANYDME